MKKDSKKAVLKVTKDPLKKVIGAKIVSVSRLDEEGIIDLTLSTGVTFRIQANDQGVCETSVVEQKMVPSFEATPVKVLNQNNLAAEASAGL